MADATGYDPKAVQAASGWSVLYAVKTSGDPGFYLHMQQMVLATELIQQLLLQMMQTAHVIVQQ